MRFRVLVVGKPRQGPLAAVIEDYEHRASRYWPLDVVAVREASGRDDPAAVKRREGERLLAQAGDARLVACDESGTAFDSPRFAAWLQAKREAAQDVAFVIGGAFGLDDALMARAHERLALAPWTLPHEVARLVLAEQLYRAGTIVRREPYHK
jgi:23S rRNA (pseudouridine1915-N3)-methyltransferase